MEFFDPVTSSLSGAVPESRCHVSILKPESQPGHPHFFRSEIPVVDSVSVLTVFYSSGTVYLLRWSQTGKSLSGGLFRHMSQRVGKLFLVSCLFCCCCCCCCWCPSKSLLHHYFYFQYHIRELQFVLPGISANGIDFFRVLVFYSDGMFDWFSQSLVLWHLASRLNVFQCRCFKSGDGFLTRFLKLRKSGSSTCRETTSVYLRYLQFTRNRGFFIFIHATNSLNRYTRRVRQRM